MSSPVSSWVIVWLVACGSEVNFQEELPLAPSGEVNPVDGAYQVDRYPIWEPPIRSADVLFVVDGSCSMTDDRELLNQHVPIFVENFKTLNFNYHIGVIDAGDPDGQLMRAGAHRWIDENNPEPLATFRTMVERVRGQSAVFSAVQNALSEPASTSVNLGFRREDIAIHTIMISDESEFGGPADFIGWYSSLMPEPEDRTFSAITSPLSGSEYGNASRAIGGTQHNILEENWEQVLEELSFVATTPSNNELFLTLPPVLDSIRVEMRTTDGGTIELEQAFYQGEEITEGHWVYIQERNSAVFVDELPEVEFDLLTISYAVRSGVVVEDD